MDGAPEADVLVAVLLLHTLGDLLKASRVGDRLVHADGPPTHPPLGWTVHPDDDI